MGWERTETYRKRPRTGSKSPYFVNGYLLSTSKSLFSKVDKLLGNRCDYWKCNPVTHIGRMPINSPSYSRSISLLFTRFTCHFIGIRMTRPSSTFVLHSVGTRFLTWWAAHYSFLSFEINIFILLGITIFIKELPIYH